mmetsp:Transcript_32217/g.76526  ORF Transcript_32217/g.76526 Transcript_32217/m.76526 type:complete len:316 (-) Transcript_32217:527-1474(-)
MLRAWRRLRVPRGQVRAALQRQPPRAALRPPARLPGGRVRRTGVALLRRAREGAHPPLHPVGSAPALLAHSPLHGGFFVLGPPALRVRHGYPCRPFHAISDDWRVPRTYRRRASERVHRPDRLRWGLRSRWGRRHAFRRPARNDLAGRGDHRGHGERALPPPDGGHHLRRQVRRQLLRARGDLRDGHPEQEAQVHRARARVGDGPLRRRGRDGDAAGLVPDRGQDLGHRRHAQALPPQRLPGAVAARRGRTRARARARGGQQLQRRLARRQGGAVREVRGHDPARSAPQHPLSPLPDGRGRPPGPLAPRHGRKPG